MRFGKTLDKTTRLKPGNWYYFTIIKVVTIPHDQDYFQIRDEYGYNYLVPSVYYSHYGLCPGKGVWFRLDRINCLGRLFFEPEHPVYKQGSTYQFNLLSIERVQTGNRDEAWFAVVSDAYGQEWRTVPFKTLLPLKSSGKISCLVKRIKKARLYLEVNEGFAETVTDQH